MAQDDNRIETVVDSRKGGTYNGVQYKGDAELKGIAMRVVSLLREDTLPIWQAKEGLHRRGGADLMAIVRTIHAGGKDIPMRASALIPRLYRVKFGRDLIRDMQTLRDNFDAAKDDDSQELTVADLALFENIAWLLAKHADPAVPSDPDEWLDSIDCVLSIYEVLPDILSLWSENLAQTSVPAKK